MSLSQIRNGSNPTHYALRHPRHRNRNLEPDETELHTIISPSLHPYHIDAHHHRVLVRPHSIERHKLANFVISVHQMADDFLTYAAPAQNGQLVTFPESHPSYIKMRLQNSIAGKLLSGAVQGIVSAGTSLVGDRIGYELTLNDSDHPQRTTEQLEEDKKEEKNEKGNSSGG